MFQTVLPHPVGDLDYVNVRFEYEHKKNKHLTFCIIENSYTGERLVSGMSKCHRNDAFSKVVGRRMALNRALKSSDFDRTNRVSIWDNYESTLQFGACKFDIAREKMKAKVNQPSVTDTQIIYPRRVFSCKTERRLMMRKEVWKDHQDRYHCGYCADLVEDVTLTTTGHDFMEILGL